MKTTREVFMIMNVGKIDERDHEVAKKTQFCQFVNNASYGSRHVTSFYVGNALSSP